VLGGQLVIKKIEKLKKKGRTMEDKNEKRRAIESKIAEVVEFCKKHQFIA